MANYLVAINRGSNSFGLDNELLRRTANGVFLLKVNTKNKPIKKFHIADRLGDANEPFENLERRLLRIPGRDNKARSGTYVIEPMQVALGCKIGRIKRPVHGWGASLAYQDTSTFDRAYFDRMQRAVHLYRKLVEFGRIVDLSASNLNVFGNALRDVLVLSCFEVEALFKMLMFDDFKSARGRMPTFWEANQPAKLNEYQLRFPDMPDIGPVKPFASWTRGATATYSPLNWFQSYNNVKHNAVAGSSPATLGSVLNALSACFILLSALHGPAPKEDIWAKRITDTFDQCFWFENSPEWSPGEHYWMAPATPLQFSKF